jgi:hypothetical protein
MNREEITPAELANNNQAKLERTLSASFTGLEREQVISLDAIIERLAELEPSQGKIVADVAKVMRLIIEEPTAGAEQILKVFPAISILEDAKSYGGAAAEVPRTQKSQIVLTRFIADQTIANGGDKASEMLAGLATLRELTIQGLVELGEGAGEDHITRCAIGAVRLFKILSIHDIAKSEIVARTTEHNLGCSDHDMALSALVGNQFEVLRGKVSDEQLSNLQELIQDKVIFEFFSKARDIVGFNAGRHLQGEAPELLFTKSVKGVSAASIAEFIADWGGVDGHKNLTGPLALSFIPVAINGTASALQKLVNVGPGTPREIWQEFSYPAEDLQRLGLSFSTDYEKAVTRVAFMGREHQENDVELAKTHIKALRSSFEVIPQGVKQQLIAELNAPDLDLGFTPHNIKALRDKTAAILDLPVNKLDTLATTKIYEIYLLALHRVIEQARLFKIDKDIITINMDNKANMLANAIGDALGSTRSAAQIVAQVDITAKKDAAGVVSAEFLARPESSAWDKDFPKVKLASLKGRVFLVGGCGGGGDIYQGGLLATILEQADKSVSGLFSVRRGKFDEVLSSLPGARIIDREEGILQITSEVEGIMGTTNRLPERGVARALRHIPLYLIVDSDHGDRLDSILKRLAEFVSSETGQKVESIVGVDTGGDSLQPLDGNVLDASIATPDQDHESLKALTKIKGLNTYSVVVAPGIDSPANFPEVLSRANAEIYHPNTIDIGLGASYFERSELGSDTTVFSRTSLVVKELLRNGVAADGHTYIEGIPLDKRLSRKNPWQSWVDLSLSMRTICIMESSNHLRAIS